MLSEIERERDREREGDLVIRDTRWPFPIPPGVRTSLL